MRNVVTFTISGVRGIRQYSLGAVAVMMLRLAVTVLVVVLAAGSLMIFVLSDTISQMDADHSEMVSRYEQSLAMQEERFRGQYAQQEQLYEESLVEQQDLYGVLREEQQKNVFLDQSLERLEELIGVDGSGNGDLRQRVAMAEQNSLERRVMLSLIPSGYPLKGRSKITSGFGQRYHPLLERRYFHRGIDFSARIGTPVHATADGAIEFAGVHRSGYGKLIIISHAFGFKSLYAHLSKVLVRVGQVVHKGQKIALSGNTGVSTGPHLHYEISFVQKPLNPKNFVRWGLERYNDLAEKERYVPWESLIKLDIFHPRLRTKASSPVATTSMVR